MIEIEKKTSIFLNIKTEKEKYCIYTIEAVKDL